MKTCTEKDIKELNKISNYFSCYIFYGFHYKIPVTYFNGKKVMINGIEFKRGDVNGDIN
jgi:hypothetical protein